MRLVLTILILTVLISCEDPITVSVPEGNSKLVVEGVITNQMGQHQVKLSRTSGFLDIANTPKLSEATVSVQINDGTIITYSETEIEGTYVSDSVFQGEPGSSYKLSVSLNRAVYESDFQTLKSVPEIDDISFSDLTVDDLGFQAILSTRDNPTMGDFYRYKIYRNNNELGTLADLVLRSDRFFNGNSFEVEFEGFPFELGDSCTIEQFSLTESAFDFFRLIQIQAGDLGESTSTSPTQVIGNIRNIENSNEEVLGFFYATSVTSLARRTE